MTFPAFSGLKPCFSAAIISNFFNDRLLLYFKPCKANFAIGKRVQSQKIIGKKGTYGDIFFGTRKQRKTFQRNMVPWGTLSVINYKLSRKWQHANHTRLQINISLDRTFVRSLLILVGHNLNLVRQKPTSLYLVGHIYVTRYTYKSQDIHISHKTSKYAIRAQR